MVPTVKCVNMAIGSSRVAVDARPARPAGTSPRHDFRVPLAKRADRAKMLVYDGPGLVLIWKRLEGARFKWPAISDE